MAELRHPMLTDWRSSLIYFFPSFSHNKVGIYAKQVKRAVTAVADRISQYLENKTVLANALLRRSKLHESVCKA